MLGVQVPPGLPFPLVFFKDEDLMDQFKEKVQLTVQKIIQFLKDAQAELKKVTWPTPKQAMASTAVVIVLVFLVSIILGIVDFALAKIVNIILG